LFLSFLAVVMIASSHSADRKVHEIAQLTEEVKKLNSEFVDGRQKLMELKMESYVRERLVQSGLGPSDIPPQKIKVSKQD